MPSKWNILARFARRTENAVITQLYSLALNRPLLIHPAIGESLLQAYMHGAVDYPQKALTTFHAIPSAAAEGQAGFMQSSGRIAVMNISGALVSRPTAGPSGPGPQSYEALAETFDELVSDSTVKAIILRMDSPGGLVSGLFDFTDHIYEARQVKPIHAVVDDIAYSAAYAIAAAAEYVWVTRTSGVGSIGVVGFHYDQSAYNENIGVKVTPIYAGAHKVDFSPHFELSEDAKARAQADIDQTYTLFVASVEKYRGIDADVIRKTEALTYCGEDGVAKKLADQIGTLDDAIEHLSKVGNEDESSLARAEEKRKAEEARAAVAAAEESKAEADRIKGIATTAVMAAELPVDVRQALLQAEIAEHQIDARVKHAVDVVAACALMSAGDKAAKFVSRNVSIDEVKADLLEDKTRREQEISTTLPKLNGRNEPGKLPGAWRNTIVKHGGKCNDDTH
jgi:signal peptide peptidase SppA